MPYSSNNDLSRAIEALTIFTVWEHAAQAGDILTTEATPRHDGLVKSPFREDGRKGSFSICHGGRGFKDFGGDGATKGGVWQFAKLCWPSLNGRELAVKLIAMSGITPTPPPRPRQPGDPAPVAAEVDPKIAAAARALERREKEREREEFIHAEREKLLAPRVEAKPVPTWPDFVRDRYEAGERRLISATAIMSKLARDRGWDPVWVCELVNMGLLSYPIERWHDEGGARETRQKAFAVYVPEIKLRGACDAPDASAVATLRPVGYHQRTVKLGKPGEAPQKGWVFVPSMPKPKEQMGGWRWSRYEEQLVEYGAPLGVTPDKRAGLIPPLPFVMGDVGAARLIVLLEGQWDAITFFGACGFFNDATPPEGVAVFGIRGAQGVDVFLAYWALWLKWNKPMAWVIADNDTAGKSWIEAPKPKNAEAAASNLPAPSFAERLMHAGCHAVKLSWLKPGPWGKDFNDYYKARTEAGKPIGPAQMRAWAEREGLPLFCHF